MLNRIMKYHLHKFSVIYEGKYACYKNGEGVH